MKKIFYVEKHMKIDQTFEELSKEVTAVLSTFEKSSNITSDDQTAKNKSTKAFATKQLSKSKIFDSFKSKKRHCVFRFVLTSIFFKIFLFRNNRVIISIKIFSSFAIF